MTDRKALDDQKETPEDVATLYSWANLHGAKYRDFSASRAVTRENARQRVQQAIEEERLRAREESELKRQAELQAEAENARLQAEEQARQEAERERQRVAKLQKHARLHERAAESVRGPAAASSADHPAQKATRRQAGPMIFEEASASLPGRGIAPAAGESGRPAWLVNDQPAPGDRPARGSAEQLPPAPEDTLQGSRDRLTSRWFALKSVFEGSASPVESAPAQSSWKAPVLAVFSLAGGVGKTCLTATLGRALSARGERVLLVDTAAFGLLPFYFGARDQRPGVLRTFTPPGGSGDAPLQMLALDPESLGAENAPQEMLSQQILRHAGQAGRVIVDLSTASGALTRRILRLSPTVLVPVVPDLNSVVSVASIDAFFQRNSHAEGGKLMPYYVLNQFDASLPLHLDVREVLREQLGDRLLPLALRRSPAVSEALAEGMTVMDYAPNSAAAEDFGCLAGWLKNLAAAASANYRGVRWSER
jgi:cellulose synthase operon protein YhjQ